MYRMAVIAVLAGMLVPAVQAQRGSFGRAAPPRAAPAARMVAPRGAPVPIRTSPAFRSTFAFRNGRFFRHHHRFIFTSGCFNGAFFDPFCRGAFFNAPLLAPPIFWPSFWPSYDYGSEQYAAAQAAPAPAYNDTALQVQIQRLTGEIEELRREQEARNRPPQASEPPPSRADLPTVFVFRDGHRIETSNYGMAGQTLWVFTEQRARKIPLSDLDLVATRAVNEERGVNFVVPGQR